jgi:uncharacterized membrane protein
VRGLVAAAQRLDGVFVLIRSPGDFVPAGGTLIEVHAAGPADGRELAGMVALGDERTIDQDPAFALRIIVDIAIRALSPAVNDPTTAVQMIDQIEGFLFGIAQAGPRSDHRVFTDETGAARLVVPTRRLDAYFDLGLTEIIWYGGHAPQVCRRLASLFDALDTVVDPRERHLLETQRVRLAAAVDAGFPDPRERALARVPDPQGIGGPRPLLVETGALPGRPRR